MKMLTIIEFILALTTVGLLFIDWKIAIVMLLITVLLHVIPSGPHALFRTIIGSFFIAGMIYIFIDWRIGIGLVVASFLIAKFYGWGNQKNIEYYGQKQKETDSM